MIEAQACGIPCIISNNITDKIDLGINLISKASIDDLTKWGDLIKTKSKKCKDRQMILNALSSKGYNIAETTEYLTNIYLKKN